MQVLTLGVVSMFGRYTVLLLVALLAVPLWFWFDVLDHNPFAALLLLAFASPLIITISALLVGLVLAGARRSPGPFVSRDEAPGLWRLWDEARPGRGKRLLRVDGMFNASISERRRFLGLFGREAVMTVGLPMIMAADEAAVRTVIRHEMAHQRLRHTSGAVNVFEFEQSIWTVFEALPPDQTIAGSLLFSLIGRLGGWLEAEERRLSRRDELKADAGAVHGNQQTEAARSLALVLGLSHHFSKTIVAAWSQDLRTGTRVPPSPLRRLEATLPELRLPHALDRIVETAYAEEADPKSTHPSLKERLAALGTHSVPKDLQSPGAAADSLLAPQYRTELFARLSAEWDDHARAHMRID
jgi:Peptidase family M48